MPEMKKVEFANSVDPDKVVYYEPPHMGGLTLLSSLIFSVWNSIIIFASVNFVVYMFGHFQC